jgi:hypothetical protein
MKRFIEGEVRTQVTLLPECLDDYVTQENPVRVVDVFVDELDLGALGFEGTDPADCCRSRRVQGKAGPSTRLFFEYQGCFLDSGKAPVGIELRKNVHLLENPLSIALDQIDDMALCVTVRIDMLIENGNCGLFDNFAKQDDACDERRTVIPASIGSLAKRRAEVPIDCFLRG